MRLVVARVGRPHGVRGEVTVEVRTDVPDERFFPGAVLRVTGPDGSATGGPSPGSRSVTGSPGSRSVTGPPGSRSVTGPALLTVRGVRGHRGGLLLTFAEVTDRSAAEALRGVLLEAEVADDPGEPDAWYDHQLVGLRVEDPAGALLGEVVAVEHAPAQDLLVVSRPDRQRRLVPFVGAIVPTVDVGGGRLVVVDPGGLLTDLDEQA
jgi:16S rRNA processing protein RimM